MPKKYSLLHDVVWVYTLILVVWGFYRLLFRFPDWVEELILKPIVFIGPVWYRLSREQGKTWRERWVSLGITGKNLPVAVVLGLALGVFYLLMGKLGVMLNSAGVGASGGENNVGIGITLGLALATAISEQLVFMGYMVTRLTDFWKNEWLGVGITALLFAVIHVPILVFGYQLPIGVIASQFLLTFFLGMGNGLVMVRTRNLAAPVIAHSLWGVVGLI